ncbi:hypothetical protein G9G63_10125 [Paenibacillus sp. EKM202P]|nr:MULTISPECIES: hypothetical protein [unclassified Paenibacillus]KAF6564491.1 hypothetical protein G9G63_10125 [Paenibacillus sp. EKM202P]KAF6571694.1 hypothetical protein G9G64_06650 [Paenibacillus sp. EKM207P]
MKDNFTNGELKSMPVMSERTRLEFTRKIILLNQKYGHRVTNLEGEKKSG